MLRFILVLLGTVLGLMKLLCRKKVRKTEFRTLFTNPTLLVLPNKKIYASISTSVAIFFNVSVGEMSLVTKSTKRNFTMCLTSAGNLEF